jgi:hypothetical protein
MLAFRNSNKFLLVVLSVFAISVVTFVPRNVQASGRRSIRGHKEQEERNERSLKKSKNNASTYSGQYTQPAATARPTPAFDPNGISTKAWDAKCPQQANDLDKCVGGGSDVMTCRQCIMGQANRLNPTLYGLTSCVNPAFGNWCNGCRSQLITYYNCGAGGDIDPPPVAITIPSNSGNNAGAAAAPGGIGVNVPITAEISSGTVTGTSAVSMYNPNQNECPTSSPASGDSCVGATGSYKYIKCFYPTSLCTCNSTEQPPKWLCNSTD